MTAADEHYMVDVDDEELLAFLAWYRDAFSRGLFRGLTTYSLIKMAWMAAKNGPPEPAPLPESMMVSTAGLKELTDEQYRVPMPLEPLPATPWDKTRAFARAYGVRPERFYEPDFVQHGTVTGRIPRQEPDPFEAVRLSGPQQAALDSLYPVDGTNLRDPEHVLDFMPVVGPVEDR